ncbi:uncharacterized protein LOC124643146 [Helicoverpa zea]|uniref:uncharacterized protein LOC124643146 n=1 Tax=Helicoverpa zea TaxID=7113 RepID=UPI001F57EB4F|nr:uncharacterized protein LOC124643146 [Helicoverpa zea]
MRDTLAADTSPTRHPRVRHTWSTRSMRSVALLALTACQVVLSVPRTDHSSSVSDVERLVPLLASSPPRPSPGVAGGVRRDFMPLGENSDMVLRYMHAPRRRPPPWLTRP